MTYEAVIGLEVHIQLRTETKIFCRCPNQFGSEPNTLICPLCLGYPGTLPILNRKAVDLAVKLALALGAHINQRSVFARKSYFYADLPKGYQITQHRSPLAEGGQLPLIRHAMAARIHRLHLEEDAGKLLHTDAGTGHAQGTSLVDFNRCGVPLVEIVSEPDLTSPSQAHDYLQSLHQLLIYTGTSDGNMEEGSFRCDANVSVRPRGTSVLGTKTEIKNLNSFRNAEKALNYEIDRQIDLLETDHRIVHETRSFDADQGVTRPMRSKEEAHDYRYFPEPDLPPLTLDRSRIEHLYAELAELPWERRRRYIEAYNLADADAHLLTSNPDLAAYFESAVITYPKNPLGISNWIKNEILRNLNDKNLEVCDAVAPERLARLVSLVDRGQLSSTGAKTVLNALSNTDEEPEVVAESLRLIQVRDQERISLWVNQVIREHPDQVARFHEGKTQLLGFFIGRLMKASQGRAEPKIAKRLLQEALEEASPEEHKSSRNSEKRVD